MYKIIEQTKGENSTIDLKVSVPFEDLLTHKADAIKHLNEHVEVAGFRKGHVPENILVQKVGEQALLEECAEHTIESIYGDIVLDAKIRPITHPKILITKIGKDNPLEFTLTIEVVPEVTLPDYKKIASKAKGKDEEVQVTDKEVDDVVANLLKRFSKEGEELTELSPDMLKQFGDFKDMEALKSHIRENIKKEKEVTKTHTRRKNILDAIAKEIKTELPLTFIEQELDQMTHEFSYELGRMGQTFESYKEVTKKTEEEIRTEWREKAKERVLTEIILQKIAEAEKITPSKEEVEKEVAHMMEHYPETPKERIVSFVEDSMTKQEVFKLLEQEN